MMKNLFKKTPATKTEYRQAREANTSVFHIQRNEGHPLCGSRKVMKSGWAVTVEEVVSSATTQHSGFIWCAGCGAAFTGRAKAVFTATRFRVSRAS
jgi:hypothetical protein